MTMTPYDPADILYRLLIVVRHHFTRTPLLLTTDRRGRYEGAWCRGGDGHFRPMGNAQMSLAVKQHNQNRMAALVTEYADHPRAVQELIKRSEEFPQSIELQLKPGR